jgi:hypothetical protein
MSSLSFPCYRVVFTVNEKSPDIDNLNLDTMENL